MVGNFFASSLRGLSPQKQLDIVKFYLEKARTTKDPDLALAIGDDAEAALSRMKRAVKSTTAAADHTLRDGIAAAYLEHSKLVETLGYSERAQVGYKKAEKWGYRPPKSLDPAVSSVTNSKDSDVAQISDNIFPDNNRRLATKCALPDTDGRLKNTLQLAYCLGLLQITLSPNETFEPATENWVKATQKNLEETKRLQILVKDLIRAFTRDEIKDAKAVAEVVCLGPVLEKEDFRSLLELFINGVGHSALLDINSLDGLAQLLPSASPGSLDADDLVKILSTLNTRLQNTHSQSSEHIYNLTLAVSRVLDAMADTKVSGLERVDLHEPLSAYLSGLRGSGDPYMVYQADYAFQALQCVPDDESPWQATKRRTGVVLKGVSGMVSAAKGLNVSSFIEALGNLHEGLGGMIQVAKIGLEDVSALAEGGQGLVESLKVGLSFNRKRAWYTALRGTDTLLRDGQLAKFKTLICEAPCRRDVAFELGVCLRLGDLAANSLWDIEPRQDAVTFLGEIYKNDTEWGQQALVKQCIVHILMQLASSSDSALQGVGSLLLELGSNGDQTKRLLYRESREQDRSLHLLKVTIPSPDSPSLLDRVQNKPDIDADLRRLRRHRMKDQSHEVYIPPQGKANLHDSNDALFPLMEKVKEFLGSDQKVMLLLGDSGAGKSTFNRTLECDIWNQYTTNKSPIPLYINLPAIEKPEQDLIEKHLRRNDFMEPQIRELKSQREFVLICDGYDESQQIHNLYMTNQLNQKGHWRTQMVISCRSEYLPQDYIDRFQPLDQNQTPLGRFEQAVVAPFTTDQITEYIATYVKVKRPLWKTKDYLDALYKIPDLIELVRNPFLLTLTLEVLPRIIMDSEPAAASTTRVTRVELYDQFVEQWLERGKKRLSEKSDLSDPARRAFERLTEEGFTQNGMMFARDLAGAIYKHQGGNPVVDYSHKRDCKTWKGPYFNRDDENQLLLEACPLIRNGGQHRFAHRSLLEYCFTRVVFEPMEVKKINKLPTSEGRRRSISSMFSFEDRAAPEEAPDEIEVSLENHPLTWRNYTGESSIIQFLADRAQLEEVFKKQLLAMIEHSKTDKAARKAAANAITILVRAGIPFAGVDLKGIQIPGADLSGGQFDSAQLQGADLRKTELRGIWLRQADLSNARMAGAQFGEWPYLEEDDGVTSCVYSRDGEGCAVSLRDGTISVYETSTWTRTHILRGHDDTVTGVAYSPSSHQIASSSKDNTVRLWNAKTETTELTLSGHTGWVKCVVYSPSGKHIASASQDSTVRLWDAQTGAPELILKGHTGSVTSLAYSPSGHQIASSGDGDRTVRLWDARTGAPGLILTGHNGRVLSVVYSPSGHQLASASWDKTVRLWDAETGEPGLVLSGHTNYVNSVVYSPSGKQIASGSDDNKVQLWDAESGEPGPILIGHDGPITSVVYSPSGLQIASGSDDNTVRLWNVQTRSSGSISSGHIDCVRTMVFSPSGHQIASGSWDSTVRLWDARTGASDLILRGHTDEVGGVAYSPNGLQLVSCCSDNTLRLWDAQSGMPGPILSGHTKQIHLVTYSPCGKQIASGACDWTVRLWDAQTGAIEFELSGHIAPILCLVYSPNGQQIASSSQDYTARLWDTQTGACSHVLRGHTGMVWSIVYSPIGQQIASGSNDATVRLWDVQTGEPGLVFSGHTDEIYAVAYSPSGRQIASCSNDWTVRLWDTQTDAAGLVLSGHANSITRAVYSPSGQKIVSSSTDLTVRLWDVDSRQCLATVEGFNGPVTCLAWNTTSGGTSFATGCDDGSVRMWQVVEDDDVCQVRMQWTTNHDRLCLSAACIQDVQGLSSINTRLSEQRGCKSNEETWFQ